ncbi:unnamed protein product [Bemisia tabaci]|uniref:CHK kinase-like domain-containing protein n=1 Tax=Bemisia tabaci TaxID=7038 RepID=A0A9P0A445_BEMTA|nr:unnamed protein product [Bemisia tabaci]
MGVVERLNSTILPAAVEAGGFGKDVKKFVSFEANDTKGTDQFCSAPVFGQVTLERSTSERFVQPVLVKTQIQSRTGFPTKEVSDGWFYNEILFYTKVVPLLRKYDKCNVLSSSFCEFVYGATTDNPNSEENVIVLKDLREKGFKPCTNPDQLDGDHIELVLDRLGKYHALSFMCKTDNPSGFHEVASQIKQISHAEAISSFAGIITKEAFRECVFRGIEPLRKEPRYQDKLVDLCANCENAYDWIDKYGFDSRNRLTVITHGDFKLDNMMFKYREDGKPIEVVFFDLAWIKLSSPAIDTSYFLFYNVPTVARRGRLHHLHRVYHEAKESKVRVYKTVVRPVLTYAAETRADTKRTKQQLRTVEMKVLRKIAGFTLRDRQTNESIREECQIQDIAKWTKMRRKMWSEHVERMDGERLAKICMVGRPHSQRQPGRPPKRWAQSCLSSPEN